MPHFSPMDQMKPFSKFSTSMIHVGSDAEKYASRDMVPPISLAVTFQQSEPGVFKLHDYSRGGNPTRDALELALAVADNAAYAITFGSGTGALASIIHLLESGNEVVSMVSLYGGTHTYFDHIASKNGIIFTYVDLTDVGKLAKSLTRKTKMVFLESPTNPCMTVVDIPDVVRTVKSFNRDIIIVIDNTFTTPYFMRPLDFGVDISYQAITKYVAGHTDVVMGSAAVNCEKLAKKLQFLQVNLGAVPSPFDCYLVIRSLKTFPLRMKEHMRNGLTVARFLERHPCVTKVNHPGLQSHPQHLLFKCQSRGYSGMLSFYLKGGKTELFTFFRNLKVFQVAASFGGCESVASYPCVMTHDGIDADLLQAAGITENLARLSVGLEDVEDLLEDLDQALWSSQITATNGIVRPSNLQIRSFLHKSCQHEKAVGNGHGRGQHDYENGHA